MKKLSLTIFVTIFAIAGWSNAVMAQPSNMGECRSIDIQDFPGNVVDAALATPSLSILASAVVDAGLDGALSTTENITVYAPTDEAFQSLPVDILGAIVGDIDLLTSVLTYHVTPSRNDPRRYVEGFRRKTLQGQYVFYSRYDQTPRVNNAGISCQGVRASNGLIWIIDSVLFPNL